MHKVVTYYKMLSRLSTSRRKWSASFFCISARRNHARARPSGVL